MRLSHNPPACNVQEFVDAAAAGAAALGVKTTEFGLLTTPQLHWMVMQRNLGHNHWEFTYYEVLAAMFEKLVAGTEASGEVRHHLTHHQQKQMALA